MAGARDQHLAEMKAMIAWAESEDGDIPIDVLEYMARMFPQYSYRNRILIAVQWLRRGKAIEDLHDLAGFHSWRDLGCGVRKGAQAIWIYAPMIKKDEDGDPDFIGCKPVSIFAYSRNDDASEVDVKDAPLWAKQSAKRDSMRDTTRHEKQREKAQAIYPPNVRDAMGVLGIDCLEVATIKAAYRKAALAAHPDHGGDLAAMKRINAAKDVIDNYLESQPKKKAA
jgi:hypothetical protein